MPGADLTWPAVRMAKMMDIAPSRLRQLVAEGIVPKAGRDRFRPFEVNIAYIRFLRDRVQSPELSDSEFHKAKLAKLRSEREQIELDMQIKRGTRIPKEDVDRAWQIVVKSIAGIIKANRNKLLTDEQINEIFDLMRAEMDRLHHQHGNGSVLVQDTV